ncbi:preprotein translocase subunit SecD [Geoalkalibacter ferrihydriticus]|uniref:Protein translocase subunit SecD n=2 Tax=Geoalkalibacter ferrihydriticus TaxID=392333 RepID=A0A0C2HNX5_9BACT|nr:protein translocase subunit SecD [Geoalkalibacter ferrihydriticus]KIH76615.1 preprotein translocase subunit SecD [Geoalkalibacter ferrihydriticus DSM 17813]SDM03630.1 preprotein translocase subunit SecD [Geoalkalibacter ferrihydriticus]
MSKSLKMRGAVILLLVILSFFALGPTLFGDKLPEWWTRTFDPIHLGLDLQGGMHLILGVEVDKAVESRLDSLVDQAESLLRERDLIYRSVSRDLAAGGISITVYDEESARQVERIMRDSFPNLEEQTQPLDGGYIAKHFRFTEREIEQIRDYAHRQALETLRNRVDQFGVTEPVLQRQADHRILIQLPGVDDPHRAIALLGKTARLEFKMVAEDVTPTDIAEGRLPSGTEILYERRVDPRTGAVTETPVAVHTATLMTGDLLADAQVRIDPRFNEPYVAIDFNALGARRFDQITAANVGRRMAIVLDDTVYSAPVIRERISGGSAQISGAFTEREATDLAIVLRAGSLPAPVQIMENRTVGPSLGRDSIQQGIVSITVGGALVVVAIAVYYGLSGLVAILALVLNLVFIMAMLTLFKASLTLPGIAGIVLTVGMAVDANVLIFERIREELRIGKTARAALEAGYAKAFSTIIDANITTLVAALVLFQFGTGPVKGFAVTLSVGIIASLFTAIFVTRTVFDYFLTSGRAKRLSIG